MNLKAFVKNRKFLAVLLFLAVGIACLGYLGDYFDGSGSWTVLQADEVKLVDVGGELIRVRGDFHMSLRELQSLQNWLESQRFSLKATDSGKSASDLVYQGRYQNSLPIEVTIAAIGSKETPSVDVSYKGHGFKRIFDARKKKVEMFSNEMVRICTENVF